MGATIGDAAVALGLRNFRGPPHRHNPAARESLWHPLDTRCWRSVTLEFSHRGDRSPRHSPPRTPLSPDGSMPPAGMKAECENAEGTGCTACGYVEEPSAITDNMARFANRDDRTMACLRRVGVKVPMGTEIRLCRQHAILLERELTRKCGAATPYVQPLAHTVPTVGVDTRPQMALLTTWVGDSFLPPATLGPEFRLFGMHRARRVSVEFEGRRFSGVWLPDCHDFVRLRAI